MWDISAKNYKQFALHQNDIVIQKVVDYCSYTLLVPNYIRWIVGDAISQMLINIRKIYVDYEKFLETPTREQLRALVMHLVISVSATNTTWESTR